MHVLPFADLNIQRGLEHALQELVLFGLSWMREQAEVFRRIQQPEAPQKNKGCSYETRCSDARQSCPRAEAGIEM
jgi:hypothetical protein